MFFNIFQGKPLSQNRWQNSGSAPPGQSPHPAASAELPPMTPDIADFQRPPRPGSQQSPRALGYDAHSALQYSAQPGLHRSQPHAETQARPLQTPGSAATPGRAHIQVVLEVSPHRPPPQGVLYFGEADLDGEPGASDLARPGALSAPQLPTTASASASATPAPLTNVKRSRGRPKGWRPGMPSFKTGLRTASSAKHLEKDSKLVARSTPVPKSTGHKRRGRPPRQPSPTPREVWEKKVAPRYVAFLCEWPGCNAELLNIDKLRKHIRVVHGRKHPLVCRWAGCSEKSSAPFTDESDFQCHVDEEHLLPFTWHVGDGPRNEKLVNTAEEASQEMPAYLLGADGEQMTPWVKDQEIEDFYTWRENRRRLRNILMQRDANAPSDDEDENRSRGDSLSPRG